jgi:hypothetical protein
LTNRSIEVKAGVSAWQRLAAVILSVIPPRRTSKTRSHQMDSTTDLTCKDGTAHHVVDGWEATHNRSVLSNERSPKYPNSDAQDGN